MAKQLNVNLAFNADTSKAKAQIQELYQNLNNVSTTTAKLPITTQIQEAQTAAIQLKTAMGQAFDVNTGKLDLLKFNQSIKASGTSLQEIRNRLVSIGPVGQQTFLSLAQSIAAAEIPAKRTSALLTSLGVTLKNTIKWQFSSSMLHGFMGAVQSAYGYVQNLNSSLNDIRIVTGQSAEEMDRFAARANKAAKALSASTLDYTNASLIYYQQGLNDKEVEERTNVTVKMANVTGKTAQEISQQMTAVWNNFDDGSKSLEYYADVMTALGAATASSTDEISQGLQKFSAVAETVGLSYEYATAALATITATTRESADVVGTALKTLFARIQGLKLGETLEDGTDLNKYSQALAKVGISIFEQNGELKDMDNILNEMAAKWETLNGAQQTALAQTVAGVRQYTHLVALMENWDFMKSNLDVAYGATGTLNEQADIYAESWEAARDRVKAAAEAIYSNLLKDDFFIDFTNGIEKVLTLFNHFIESIGGAKGVLLGLSSILLHTFSNTIASNIENMVYNVKSFVGIAQREAINTQNLAASLGQNSQTGNANTSNQPSGAQVMPSASPLSTNVTDATTMGMQAQLQLTHAIAQKRDSMTAAQQQEASAILAQNQAYADQLVLLAQKADTARTNKTNTQDEIMDLATLNMSATKVQQILSEIDTQVEFGEKISSQVAEAEKAFKSGEMSIDAYQKKLQELSQVAASKNLSKTSAILSGMSKKSEADLQGQQVAATVRGRARAEVTQNAKNNFKGTVSDDSINQHVSNVRNAIKANDDYARSVNNMQNATANASKKISNFSTSVGSVSQSIVKASQTMMSLSFAINSFKNLGNIWSDESLSGGEKILQTFMSLGMAIPMLVNGLTGLNSILGITSVLQQSAAVSSQLYLASHQQNLAILTAEQQAELANNMAKATGMSLDQAKIQVSNAVGAAKLQEAFASKTLTAQSTAEQIAAATGIGMDQAEIISSKLQAGATLEEASAEAGLTATKTTGIAAAMMGIFTKGVETGARWANVVAMIAEQTAMSPLLIMTLLLVAAMLALAAAIALVVVAAKAISNAYNADAIAAEKAKSAAKDLADAYKTAKEEYDNLINSMEQYQSARDGLDSLTKGTAEFNEQLQQANRAAQELINTYPDLFTPNDYYWENGQLIISDEAQARAKQTLQRKEAQAYAGMQFGQVNALETQNISDITDLKRQMAKETWSVTDIFKTGIKSFIGSMVAGPMGIATAIGGQYTKEINKLDRTDAINKAALAYQQNNGFFESGTWEMMKTLGIYDIEIIKSLKKNQDEIIKLSDNITTANNQRDLAAEASARELMASNTTIQASGYMEDLGVIGGKILSETQSKAYDKFLSQMDKKRYLKSYADDYFDSQNISSKSGFRVDKYNANKGIVSYSYLDEDGKRVEAEVTAEQIAQTRALVTAQEELFSSCRSVIDSFKLLDKDINNTASETSKLSEGLKTFLASGGAEGLTKAQYDALSSMSNEEAIKYLESMGITQKNIQDFGYTDLNSLISEFNQPNLNEEWAKYDNITSRDGAANLNLEEVRNLQQTINNISDFFGEEIGNQLLDLSEEMANSLDEAGKTEFWKQLGKITDFTDAEQWENFIEAMKESGNLTEEQIAIFEEYADAAQLAAKATKEINFDTLAENLRNLRDILNNFKEGNREISDEEFEILKANGIDTSQFAKTIDGYRFLGDSADFMATISSAMEDQLREAEQHFSNAAEIAEQASQNLAEAEANLEKARTNAEGVAASSISSFELLKTMINNFVNSLIQVALNRITDELNRVADVLMSWYDTAVNIINFLGDSLVNYINKLMSDLVDTINGLSDLLAWIYKMLGKEDEFTPFNLDWDELTFDRMKTADEIAAEEEYAKSEAEKAEADQAFLDSVDDIVKAIEASADFKTEEELRQGQAAAQVDVTARQTAYNEAVALYGEDSQQAQTAKMLLEASQRVLDAYTKAIDSKFWGDVANEYDLDPQVLEQNAATLEAMAESSEDIADNLADGTEESQKTLRELSKEMLRFQKATEAVADNYDDWNETLTDGSIADQAEIMEELETAYTDMLDLDMGVLSDGFLKNTENLKLMKEAAEGSTEAYNELQKRAAKDLLEETGLKNLPSDFANIIDELADVEGIDIGEKITVGENPIADKLNTMYTNAYNAAIAGGKSVAEAMQIANAAINAVGFEAPEIEMEEKTVYVTGDLPDGAYPVEGGSIIGPDGLPLTGYKWEEEAGGQYQYAVTMMVPKGKASFTKSAENFGGGSSKKDNGGGGGGGSKSKKADKVKKSDVVTRYKEVDDLLDDVADTMTEINDLSDRLYGADKLKQMQKVNDLLRKEVELNKQKKQEAQQYLDLDRKELQQVSAEAGITFEFDDNGNISNYTEQMTKLYEELDSAIESANADGNADEDEQEYIDNIQEKIDKVTEAIEQYEETRELITDLDAEMRDKLNEIYDNEIEAFQYKVELDLELSDDALSIIEFQLGQIEDDAFKAAESIALTSKQAETLYDKLMTSRTALDEASGLSDIAWDLGLLEEGQEFTEAQIDLMKEYRDNIMDVIEEMSELRETVEDQVMEVFDAWNDKLETNMDTLDHFGSMLDSYKNIVDIVGQDTMGLSEGFMQNMQNASVEHALDQMQATKEAYETMMSARMRAEQALEDARARGDDASAKMWEETLTELNSNMESAQEDMLSAWEDALSTIQDNFEATVERVVETFNNAVYAFGGMEGLSNEFSRQKEMADLMVDDYQKIYELSKLNRDIQKTLDDTDVIAGKQKLLKLQEKINALEEEGVELSQYDLEYLQAEYELRMAEIELTNAQAKKDTVRLSKDNEGNWSYIYTTSTDAVDEAQQKYEDALYAMQELSSNYVDEMSEQLISTSQEMAEALAEVRASDFASQEDYEKELDRIRKMYQERLDQQEAELQKSINNNKDLYTQDWTNYHEATGYKISDTENFVTSFKDSMLGTLMQSESDTANFNNIMSSAVDILTTGLVDAATTYYLHMEQAMQAAGTSTNDFAADMQENIDTVVQKSEEGAAAVEEMAEKMASAFWDITDSVTQWQEGYGAAMQQVIDSNLAVVESFNNMLKELSIDPDSIKVEYDISTDYGLEDASSMDTGGYTGTWGTAGKLAILHEKELVLNPDDTSNFLQAIGISKTLLETIDLNARQASNGMGLLSATGFKDSSNGTLEQNVHIEATFPNVTDHNEIEEAMKNLVNTASQYANRK